jgi:CheY-like chemotaxis protein/signal transduction histidine kinase
MTEEDLQAKVEALLAENQKLKAEVAAKSKVASRALASYQQRVLQMEIIRQQNEELDRLAADLAKAKHLEEERSKELAAAHQIKSDFLASFSHEIRTPLNGILGYCDLLTREEGARLTPHGRRDLSVIRSNAKTLLSLINDILDLSKIEAGRVDIVRENVEVDALLEECRATTQEYLKGKDVTLNVYVAEDARRAFTDGLKLRQISLNLMSNAAKFTQEGEVLVDVRAEGDTLIMVVEDTGVGIPEDQLGHLFERFRRVNDKAHRKVGGTGLGLAIVRELSKLLGGSIDVVSEVGRGTKFTVILPGAVDRKKPVVQMPIEGPPSSGAVAERSARTVLLVDDDPLVQSIVSQQLEAEGYRVLIAADGERALQLAKEHRPSGVLLDIYLPKLDGWSVLAALKSDPSLSGIPVIILSVEEQRARGFALGAKEYLLKPVDADRLVSIVRREVADGRGAVLVADDDPGTREIVCRQLRHAGVATIEAADGEAVLESVRKMNPSLLILDLVIPKIDGFEVLRRLRAEGSTVPVVVLTGKELSATEEKILRDGLARVVLKGGLALEQVIQETRSQLSQERKAAVGAKKPRVLYVEDAPQNRDIVRRYLHEEYEVLLAEDGEQGVDRAQREVPDLILMDLSLPKIDGWEATRRIKADPKLRHIPVLALTAHVGKDEQERARESGCAEFITKPVERGMLVGAIRRHLARRAENG